MAISQKVTGNWIKTKRIPESPINKDYHGEHKTWKKIIKKNA